MAEGQLELGPSAQYVVHLDGEYLGQRLVERFELPSEQGYTKFERVRLTVERLGEDKT